MYSLDVPWGALPRVIFVGIVAETSEHVVADGYDESGVRTHRDNARGPSFVGVVERMATNQVGTRQQRAHSCENRYEGTLEKNGT